MMRLSMLLPSRQGLKASEIRPRLLVQTCGPFQTHNAQEEVKRQSPERSEKGAREESKSAPNRLGSLDERLLEEGYFLDNTPSSLAAPTAWRRPTTFSLL
jgi:hypothetical protein